MAVDPGKNTNVVIHDSSAGYTLGHAESKELELPEANYGAEIRAMQAIIVQIRSLTGNLEGLLFALMVNSHRVPDGLKPDKIVVMEDGDIVEKEIPRLVRGSRTGICQDVEREEDVRTATDEQGSTDTSS